jgi:4-hydroxybenzoate polyprenyltransferase
MGFLPLPIILFGLFGVLIIAVYFVINQVQHYSQKATLPRELIIACTYTAGTAGIPMLYNYYPDALSWLFIAAVLFLTLCNTLIFAILDFDHNRKTGIKSMAVRTSIYKTRTMALITALLSGTLFLSSFLLEVSPIPGVIGLSMVISYILILLLIPQRQGKYLTLLSDLVLLIPIILLFL